MQSVAGFSYLDTIECCQSGAWKEHSRAGSHELDILDTVQLHL